MPRAYSRAFRRPAGDAGRRYSLDAIPSALWAAATARAARDGVSLRALLLGLVSAWLAGRIPGPHGPRPRRAPRVLGTFLGGVGGRK